MKMGLGAMKEASLAELARLELIAWQGADLGRNFWDGKISLNRILKKRGGLGWNLRAEASHFAKKSMRFGEMNKFSGKDRKKLGMTEKTFDFGECSV